MNVKENILHPDGGQYGMSQPLRMSTKTILAYIHAKLHQKGTITIGYEQIRIQVPADLKFHLKPILVESSLRYIERNHMKCLYNVRHRLSPSRAVQTHEERLIRECNHYRLN